jgi:hypothetical protein
MLLRAEPAHSTARCPVWASRLPNTGSTRPRPPRRSEIALGTMRYTIGHDYVKSTSLGGTGPPLSKRKALRPQAPSQIFRAGIGVIAKIGLPKSSLA